MPHRICFHAVRTSQHAAILMVAFVLGCGASASKYESASYEKSPSTSVGAAGEAILYDVDSDGIAFERFAVPQAPNLVPGSESQLLGDIGDPDLLPVAADAPDATVGRKIVYNGTVQLVVADLKEFLTSLREAIAKNGGFIGTSSESGMDGSNPTATLTIRVPSRGYTAVLAAIESMGTVERRTETSRDVTAEFVDVEARIRNKQREEARLLELLEDANGKLKEVLEVERELTRVRGEIERAQGQMNVLRDQIDLATIDVTASERTVYVAPKQAIFGDRVEAAWGNSLTRLGEFFTRAAVEFVAFVPWLTVWIPGLAIAWIVVRKVKRRVPVVFPNGATNASK